MNLTSKLNLIDLTIQELIYNKCRLIQDDLDSKKLELDDKQDLYKLTMELKTFSVSEMLKMECIQIHDSISDDVVEYKLRN